MYSKVSRRVRTNRDILRLSPRGDDGRHRCSRCRRTTRPITTRCSRGLKAQLFHNRQQIRFLYRFRKECREQVAALCRIGAAIGTDGHNRAIRVLVIGSLDIASRALTIDYVTMNMSEPSDNGQDDLRIGI